ncbi:MAG TPA: nickel-dependent lactate racemase [Patescibacteria group bacterium]|nr:nickel-dependent lactate racemase [Patescibacteria group bacterium]
MMKEYSLGLGEGEETISLPEERVLHVVEGNPYPAITDVPAAVREVLRNPIGAAPLAETVKKGDKVAIIASDVTRAWIRHDLFLPTLLDELNAAGVPDNDICLVVALGAHRHHTDAENVTVYGQSVVKRIAIHQSYAPTAEDFTRVGKTSRGVEVFINKHVVNADKVIMTGGIIYHLMAGFGGGRKSILPGVAGYSTIQGNHSFCLHDEIGGGTNPDCGSGCLEGNAMHEDMMEIAAMVNPAFLLNAVFTPEGKFARFVAGDWDKAWREGCKTVAQIFGVPIKAKADVVIASAGGFPKDINLYQGSKTIDNADLAVKENGVVILLLECRDIAEPPDFSGWFNYTSLYDREIALRKAFTVPGYIALTLGLSAKQIPHIVVTLPENKEFIERAGMTAVTTLKEAMAVAEDKLGRKDFTVTLMPHGANTVPLLTVD